MNGYLGVKPPAVCQRIRHKMVVFVSNEIFSKMFALENIETSLKATILKFEEVVIPIGKSTTERSVILSIMHEVRTGLRNGVGRFWLLLNPSSPNMLYDQATNLIENVICQPLPLKRYFEE